MDFLWHKVSESEQEEIKKEAKEIMKRFGAELKKIKGIEFEGVKRKEQLREETKAECEKEFRKGFFENLPKKEGDWVKAEKGKWK